MTIDSTTWFADATNRARFRGSLVTLAHDQLGTKESPAGSNHVKYAKWFGLDGLAWCAQYVSWLYGMTAQSYGVQSPLEGWQTRRGFAGVTNAFAVIKAKYPHYLVTNGAYLPGDIVFWDHDQKTGGPGHTGVIISQLKMSQGPDPSMVMTSEGNTNSTYSRTGGEVAEHAHSLVIGATGHHGVCLGVARPTRRFYNPT